MVDVTLFSSFKMCPQKYLGYQSHIFVNLAWILKILPVLTTHVNQEWAYVRKVSVR